MIVDGRLHEWTKIEVQRMCSNHLEEIAKKNMDVMLHGLFVAAI